MLIHLRNWTHHIMQKRVIIWLTLEAHQQDIGPDLLDLLKTMTPTVEELPHMSCLHMHGITLQKEKHNLGVEMGHRAEDLHPLEEEMGHRSEDQLPLKEEMGHRDEDQLPLEEDMVHHAEDLHPLKEEMGHLAEDLHPPKEDMGHHDEDLHPLKGGMGHHGEDLHPLKGGMGHHGEDLHLLKEEPRPRGGVHQGGGIPQQGGIPLQEGETHQEREIPHQGGGIPQQGGIPLQEGETHQEREIPLQGGGNPQQERGTPQQGREIDQNQGHHQGKLIPLDIKGSMVDLDQGLHTLGITIEDLQEEGIHQGTDHLQQGIILLKDVGHHLPTGRLDWVSLGGICLLQVLAMPPQSESWRRNLQSLDV